jgi:hypothetical protein
MDHHRAHDAEEEWPGFWTHKHPHGHEEALSGHHRSPPGLKFLDLERHKHLHYRGDDVDTDHHDPTAGIGRPGRPDDHGDASDQPTPDHHD